ESAGAEVERAIVTALQAGPEGEGVIHLRTMHLGPESLLVTAKIAVAPYESAEEVAAGIDAAATRGPAAVPPANRVSPEPAPYLEARAAATDPAIRAARRRPRR